MKPYTIKQGIGRRWIMQCHTCKTTTPCKTWQVAVLMMGTPHKRDWNWNGAPHGSEFASYAHPIAMVVHPMAIEPVSTLAEWRERNLRFRRPEFQGAA